MNALDTAPRIGGPKSFLLTLGFCVAVIAAAIAIGCDDGETVSVLPTVVEPEPPFIPCSDWNGVQPSRLVQAARVRDDPRYCFVDGECFFDCPSCPKD
jgi:hypothetical protein